MTDKEQLIASMIVDAIKAGYKVTFEGPTIGAESRGVHMHIGFIDELIQEVGNNPFEYINEQLLKGETE